jgi:hypothetical protein
MSGGRFGLAAVALLLADRFAAQGRTATTALAVSPIVEHLQH